MYPRFVGLSPGLLPPTHPAQIPTCSYYCSVCLQTAAAAAVPIETPRDDRNRVIGLSREG